MRLPEMSSFLCPSRSNPAAQSHNAFFQFLIPELTSRFSAIFFVTVLQ